MSEVGLKLYKTGQKANPRKPLGARRMRRLLRGEGRVIHRAGLTRPRYACKTGQPVWFRSMQLGRVLRKASTYSALIDAGLNSKSAGNVAEAYPTVADLVREPIERLKSIEGVGSVTLSKIKTYLAARGVNFPTANLETLAARVGD